MTGLRILKFDRSWWVLLAMTTSLSLILLDTSLLPVAMPTIQFETGASPGKMYWILNAYLLTYSTLVLGAAKVSDMIGNRLGFCLGMSIFGLASASAGLARSADLLLAARVFQGLGAAFMAPASLAILVNTFPPSKRGRAMGISVSLSSIFYALGPVLGGLITQFFSWRYAFLFNVPLAIAGIILALLSVPASPRVRHPFHFSGFLCLTSGILCLIVSLMQGRVWGWASIQVIFLFMSGLLFLGLLSITSRFVKSPFINISLFRHPVYFAGVSILFCTQFLLSNTLFWPILFQKVWDYTPFESGLLILISTAPLVIASPLGGYLSDRVGPKVPVLCGVTSFMASFLSLLLVSVFGPKVCLVIGMLFFGIGISLVMTPVGTTTLSYIPEDKRMLASGFYSTIRFTGGAMGVAALGAVKSNVKLHCFASQIKQLSDFDGLSPKEVIRALAIRSDVLPDGTLFNPDLLQQAKNVYFFSSIEAFNVMNLISLGVCCIVWFVAWRWLKPYHELRVSSSQRLGSANIPSISSPKKALSSG